MSAHKFARQIDLYLAANKLYMMLQLAGVQLMLDDLEVGVKTVKAMLAKAKDDVSCSAQKACIHQVSSKACSDAAFISTLHCCSCCSLSAALLTASATKCCVPYWLTLTSVCLSHHYMDLLPSMIAFHCLSSLPFITAFITAFHHCFHHCLSSLPFIIALPCVLTKVV